MADTIIIELDDEPIGLGMRTQGGLRFIACSPSVQRLDHQVFTSLRSIERAARELMATRRRAA
jgi:hypothetical protein